MKGGRNSSASYGVSDLSKHTRDIPAMIAKQSSSTPIPIHSIVNTSVMQQRN